MADNAASPFTPEQETRIREIVREETLPPGVHMIAIKPPLGEFSGNRIVNIPATGYVMQADVQP